MPRYYFDTVDGRRDIDNHGIDLSGEDEAISEAVRFAGDLLRDEPALLDANDKFIVIARAEGRKVIARVHIELQHET